MKALWFIGNKETTLLLKKHLKEVHSVIFVDTGFYPQEIYDYLKKAKKFFGFSPVLVDAEGKPEGVKNWCDFLRREYLLPFLTSHGYEEVLMPFKKPFSPSGYPVKEVYPLENLSDYEIWKAIRKEELPFCSLYLKGKKKIDCSPGSKRKDEEEFTSTLKSMGYL